MKNLICLFYTLLFCYSCISIHNKKYQVNDIVSYMAGSDNFKDVIDKFYLSHLRFPRDANDYTYMFYKKDSINDFNFINSVSYHTRYDNLTFAEYKQTIDSLSLTPDGKINSFLSWVHAFINCPETFKILRNEDSISVIDYCTNRVISARNFETMFNHFIEGRWSWYDSTIKVSEREMVRNYVSVKFCSIDTIAIELPDSLLKAIQPTTNILRLSFPLIEDSIITLNKRDSSSIFIVLHYNMKEGLMDLSNNIIQVKDTMPGHRFIQYLDSLIDLDSRIDFIQFCISPVGSEWEEITRKNRNE